MSKLQDTIRNRSMTGRILTLSRLPLLAASILISLKNPALANSYRIIGGIAIVMIGVGIGALLSARGLSKNPVSGARQIAEADDERAQLIRGKAATAGFVTSSVMIYLLLLWQSFASSGMLPTLSSDQVWGALVACVLLPMIVFFAAYLKFQQKY